MGFKDKLTRKTQKSSAPRVAGGQTNSSEGPREYYPKSIGIYCVDNPKVERRSVRPHVIGIPPFHKSSNVHFKGNDFAATPYWLGKLFAKPIIIELAYFPGNALYPGTDDKIFPNSINNFDKKIPLLEKVTGVKVPLTYDVVEPIENERKRLLEVLGKVTYQPSIEKLQKKLDDINAMPDDGMIRTTHEVKIIPKVFIPVLTTVVNEVEDEEGELIPTYEPILAIFEETMGMKRANALFNSKILDQKGDVGGMMDYLFGDIDPDEVEDVVGSPILLFRNPYASEGKDSLPPVCVKRYEDKIPKSLLPFFNIESAPNIDETTLLRIVVLEMIQLFTKAGDTSSIEGQIKEYFWSEVRKNQGDE